MASDRYKGITKTISTSYVDFQTGVIGSGGLIIVTLNGDSTEANAASWLVGKANTVLTSLSFAGGGSAPTLTINYSGGTIQLKASSGTWSATIVVLTDANAGAKVYQSVAHNVAASLVTFFTGVTGGGLLSVASASQNGAVYVITDSGATLLYSHGGGSGTIGVSVSGGTIQVSTDASGPYKTACALVSQGTGSSKVLRGLQQSVSTSYVNFQSANTGGGIFVVSANDDSTDANSTGWLVHHLYSSVSSIGARTGASGPTVTANMSSGVLQLKVSSGTFSLSSAMFGE